MTLKFTPAQALLFERIGLAEKIGVNPHLTMIITANDRTRIHNTIVKLPFSATSGAIIKKLDRLRK